MESKRRISRQSNSLDAARLEPALAETARTLVELASRQARPAAAIAETVELSKRVDMNVELVWDHEAIDDSFHYNALLQPSESGTFSLSFSAPTGIPWPLRGVQRWSESDLVSVNGVVTKFSEAAALLRSSAAEGEPSNRIVRLSIIRDELRRRTLQPGAADVERARGEFFLSQGLQSSGEVDGWLTAQGMTPAELQAVVTTVAGLDMLKDQIATETRIQAFFKENEHSLAFVRLVEFLAESRGMARDIFNYLDGASLASVPVARLLLADPGLQQVIAHRVRFRDTDSELGLLASRPSPGDLYGPISVDGCWSVVKVVSVDVPLLDDETRRYIRHQLFEDWLSERVRSATVQWYWGRMR